MHVDKPLGVPSGLEPSHSPLSLTRRLMRVLCAVAQVPVLPVGDTRHYDSFCGAVAAQLVRNDHAWLASGGTEQLTEEPHRSKSIPFRLYKDVEHNAVLIDCSPEVVSDAVDLQEDLVQMPFISGSGSPSSEAVGILFAELVAPTPDGLVADQHSASCHHLFHIPEADSETEVEPNAFRDDFSREAMATIEVDRHSSSIAAEGSRST